MFQFLMNIDLKSLQNFMKIRQKVMRTNHLTFTIGISVFFPSCNHELIRKKNGETEAEKNKKVSAINDQTANLDRRANEVLLYLKMVRSFLAFRKLNY